MRGPQKVLFTMLATVTSTLLLIVASTAQALHAASLRGLF
jgi:hypothetical protein